jgi:hypothetical protein
LGLHEVEPGHLTQFFDARVSSDFLQEIGRRVVRAYVSSAELSESRWSYEECHDVRGDVRRADIESSLGSLKGMFAEVRVGKRKNVADNCWHTEIFLPEVILTVSKVATPDTLIPDAAFRATIARTCQMNMFLKADDQPIPADGSLYSVLIHGPNRHSPNEPAFMHIVWPSQDGSEYLGRINLLSRFPTLVSDEIGVPAQVASDPEPLVVVKPAFQNQAK